MSETMLEPGVYSMICLIDDGSWIQPAFRVKTQMSKEMFKRLVEERVTHNAFMFLDVVRDDGVPDTYVREFD